MVKKETKEQNSDTQMLEALREKEVELERELEEARQQAKLARERAKQEAEAIRAKTVREIEELRAQKEAETKKRLEGMGKEFERLIASKKEEISSQAQANFDAAIDLVVKEVLPK